MRVNRVYVALAWSPLDNSNGCADYPGWYPRFMSLGKNTGRLALTGYVSYLWGCQRGNTSGGGTPGGRQFAARALFDHHEFRRTARDCRAGAGGRYPYLAGFRFCQWKHAHSVGRRQAVVATTNNQASTVFSAQAAPGSPSFFVFNGGPYVAAVYVSGGLVGPSSLYPGSTTPAHSGELILLYANGFGPTSTPLVSGSTMQSGSLSPLPVVTIGGVAATVQFAALGAPGEFQFNVVVPAGTPNGDQPVTATYGGLATQSGTLLTVQQ